MKTISSFRSKLLALTLALMASVSTFAYDFEYVNDFHINGFAYKVLPSNTLFPYGSAALIEIADCNKDVVIPEFVSYGNTEYRIITFGIGSVVFTNDASSVVESITIPKTTSVINKNALAGCPNLKTVVVDSENPYYDSRENCNAIITTSQNPYFTPNTLIAGCKTTIIPNSVAEIGDNAFYNCESLDIITIPSSVSKIGNSAFNACSSLSSIILSENLTAIGDWAFADCTNLSEVVCYALQPPTISKYTFPGFVPWVYVPTESIERYKAASEWKKLLICDISWFEACNEYKHVKLSVIPYSNKLIYSLVTDDGSEIPDVDSVWILNTDKEPLQKFYGQSRDTIDLLFLEQGTYILKVYLNECVKSKIFVHRPKMKYIWCDTWNVMFSNGDVYPPSNMPYRYQLAKDTVIGEHTYTAVVQKEINDALDAPRYVAAVRFTDDRKVYIYYDNAEYLLYDFNVQEGDELEVFAGINNYRFGIKTYKCIVTGVEQYACIGCPATITLHVPNHPDDFTEIYRRTQWQEGVGDVYSGFLNGVNGYVPVDGGGSVHLLCAYQGDELKYTGDLYEEYGCGDDAEQSPEDLFPTLWGLQRTSFTEYFDSGHQPESEPVLLQAGNIKEIGGKLYLDFGQYLREENGKIYIYSELLQKDFVLYDFTLELGDTLTTLNWDYNNPNSDGTISVVDYAVDCPIDTLIVTDISTITLLDGKEYKKWIFNHGYFGYVESIGTLSGLFYELSQSCMAVPGCYMGDHLVCASRNGQLLYQMDDAEMERLGAECLCDYNSGPKKDNAKNGKIGGRPTPTQWNMLEVETKKMDGTPIILRAETFSYTLENDSIVANNKTYYQLARQSTKDTAITKSFVGALHFGEDEDNRVYFLRDGVEYVLYDFTAEPGDTIEIFAGINNYPQYTTYTHVVTGKDTLENGACRMMLEVVFPDETSSVENAQKVWLAGLGSIDGIVHNAATRATKARSSDTQTSIMLCAWRDDDCLYTTDHPDYDSYGCVYNLPTSIKDIETPGGKYQKLIRDGHLYILRDNKLYDVLGTPLN